MNEDQVKAILKWIVENGNRPLTNEQKEIIKQAIDRCKTVDDFLSMTFLGCCLNGW